MRKLLSYLILLCFSSFFLCGSCEKEKEIEKKIEKSKYYFEVHNVYNKIDSTYTGLTIYKGKVDGHDVIYHIYSAKNKSDMVVWHDKETCKGCTK